MKIEFAAKNTGTLKKKKKKMTQIRNKRKGNKNIIEIHENKLSPSQIKNEHEVLQ